MPPTPLSAGSPRPTGSRWLFAAAGLLARGGPPRALPSGFTQWRDMARALRPQLRGQPGLCRPLPGRRTPFPFDPGYGNRRGTEIKPESRAGTSGNGGATSHYDDDKLCFMTMT